MKKNGARIKGERIEKRNKEDAEAEIERTVDGLRRIAALRDSYFTQKEFLEIETREREEKIATVILIEIASKNIFSGDKDTSLVLIDLLTERSHSERQLEIYSIIFSMACNSSYAEVRKRAVEELEKLIKPLQIAKLAKKFLA